MCLPLVPVLLHTALHWMGARLYSNFSRLWQKDKILSNTKVMSTLLFTSRINNCNRYYDDTSIDWLRNSFSRSQTTKIPYSPNFRSFLIRLPDSRCFKLLWSEIASSLGSDDDDDDDAPLKVSHKAAKATTSLHSLTSVWLTRHLSVAFIVMFERYITLSVCTASWSANSKVAMRKMIITQPSNATFLSRFERLRFRPRYI